MPMNIGCLVHGFRGTLILILMPRPRTCRLCVLLAIVVVATLAAPSALAQADQRRLVTAATVTLASFLNDPDMDWLRQNVGRARAVMIAPEITKAGIIVGGSGGRAVVVTRDPNSGRWVGPVFYTLATASIGLQAGISVSEVVTLVMTEKGVGRLLSHSFRMGGDVAIAVGPIEAGAQSHFVADLVSFSRVQRVRAADILVRRTARNSQVKELLNVIATADKNSKGGGGGKR